VGESAAGQCPAEHVDLLSVTAEAFPDHRFAGSEAVCKNTFVVTTFRRSRPGESMVAPLTVQSQPMPPISLESFTEQLALADQLLAGRDTMLEPQDLPGRYGRAIAALDRILAAMECEAVAAGGWAVWRHGFIGRVTQDLDVILPADRIEEFQRVAAISGFQVLPQRAGNWPKLLHKDTDTNVDILPEGARPGVPTRLAPTTIPAPAKLGAAGSRLTWIHLPGLIELKIAAGRARDTADVVELIRVNLDRIDEIRTHLASVHPDYAAAFDRLVANAREQTDQ
jgi:hypothetical protein